MRKLFLFICVIALTVACNDSKKDNGKTTDPVVKEDEKKEPKKEAKTLAEYLEFGDQSEAKVVNNMIGDHFNVNTVSVFRESETKKVFLVLKLNNAIADNIMGNFRIIARTYPVMLEDLTEASKKRDLTFDSWYFDPKEVVVNGNTYITRQMTDDVDYFNKIILQQIDMKTKKISPTKVTVEEVEAPQ